MPPIAPASKSSALITWLVVFVLLCITATIFAIYYYVDGTKARDELTTLTNQYDELLPRSQLNSEDVARLRELRNSADAEALGVNAQMSLFDVIRKERDNLVLKIDGGSDPTRAFKAANESLTSASDQTKARLTTLTGAVESLTRDVLARQADLADREAKLKAAQEEIVTVTKQMEANRAKLAEAIAKATAEAEQASASLQSDRTSKDEQIRKLTEQFAADQQAAQEQLGQAQQQVTEARREIESLESQIRQMKDKLGMQRPNTADAVIRQPDGTVVRVPGNGTVYINLGQGDQLSPGLTFQVYDPTEGIPPLGEDEEEDNLPIGKGAIEVVRVNAGSSECRIVNERPGISIREGDLIANIVYDRNTRYQFYVYGDFDLDQNGVPVPADADVVRRLVTQWGGKVTDVINVDTDFVVLGKEPEVLTPTREEALDPIIQARAQASQAAYDAYQDVKRLAQDYHIPILNQNRFLYYVGFYESAKR